MTCGPCGTIVRRHHHPSTASAVMTITIPLYKDVVDADEEQRQQLCRQLTGTTIQWCNDEKKEQQHKQQQQQQPAHYPAL